MKGLINGVGDLPLPSVLVEATLAGDQEAALVGEPGHDGNSGCIPLAKKDSTGAEDYRLPEIKTPSPLKGEGLGAVSR
jgi:hypothetical protein